MNRFQVIVSGLIVFLIPGLLAAQDGYKKMNDPETFKGKLTKASASVNSITSDFIQEKSLSVLSQKIISKGTFCFQKENNVRWEYTEPYRYLIIISSNKMYMRDEKTKKQMDIQSNPMFQQMNKFISGCIQGDILRNDNDYNIDYLESGSSYFVKLTPKNEKMKQMIAEVDIWFDKDDMSVTSLRMVESGNDYTRINFINKKLNAEISPEKFSFN